ncbi:MAG: hypothetical protein J5686_03945, partial [Bacteroidales bacterium]|nr:hypothetical protein [Bacteroidales bacterium]
FILSQDQTLHCILLYLINFSVLSWRIHLFYSLLELKGSLPFRLLFIGSLLSKNFAISFSSIADAKVQPFSLRGTPFCKYFLNYFLPIENHGVTDGNFSGQGGKSLEVCPF